MNQHSFDPLSAALGVIAVGGSLIVATGSFDTVEPDGGWWLTLFALVFGVGLIPWTRRRATAEPSEAPEADDVSG